MYKLPVWNTIGDTYRFIWAERGAWLNYILGPVLVLSLVSAAMPLLGFNPADTQSHDGIPVAAPIGSFFAVLAVSILLVLIIYISFLVAWHRRYLLGAQHSSARELLSWKRRHWVFIGRGIQLIFFTFLIYSIVALIVGLPVSLVVGFPADGQMNEGTIARLISFVVFGWAIMLFVSVWLIGLTLMFPAAAVENRGFGIRKSMALAQRNRWRMFAIFLFGSVLPFFALQIVLATISFGIMFIVLSGASGTPELPFSVGLLLGIVSMAFYFLGVAIGVSLLSLIYQRLRDNVPPETETPSAETPA